MENLDVGGGEGGVVLGESLGAQRSLPGIDGFGRVLGGDFGNMEGLGDPGRGFWGTEEFGQCWGVLECIGDLGPPVVWGFLTCVPSALALAMVRDGSSGGVIRLAAITEEGVERTVLAGSDLPWGDGGPPV